MLFDHSVRLLQYNVAVILLSTEVYVDVTANVFEMFLPDLKKYPRCRVPKEKGTTAVVLY